MTSLRQIEANRRNALKSTGPRTSAGKDRSRHNAVRHGLSAETVVTPIEDMEDYRAFEASVIANYEAETAVARELVLRLASLLWRLRRATSIETGLLKLRAENEIESNETSQLSFASYSVCSEEPGDSPPFSPNSIAQCFLHLTPAESAAFEGVRRYETALWRQLRQTLFTLHILHCQKRETHVSRLHKGWWKSTDSFDR